MPIEISEALAVTDDLREAVARLIPQLNPDKVLPTPEELTEVVRSPGVHLFVARDTESGNIVGTAALVLFRTLTGLRSSIEDVVVDDAARRRGVGERLVTTLTDFARQAGAYATDLTTQPDREAANRLYRRLGFEVRGTNPYRLRLPPRQS